MCAHMQREIVCTHMHVRTYAERSCVHTCMCAHMQRDHVYTHECMYTHTEREIVRVQKAPELLDSCQKQSNHDRLVKGASYTASPKTLVF